MTSSQAVQPNEKKKSDKELATDFQTMIAKRMEMFSGDILNSQLKAQYEDLTNIELNPLSRQQKFCRFMLKMKAPTFHNGNAKVKQFFMYSHHMDCDLGQ